jgi:hypothetical protein
MHLQHFPEADAAIPLHNTLSKRDTVLDAFLHIKDHSIPRRTHHSTSETITIPQSPITNTLTTSFPQKKKTLQLPSSTMYATRFILAAMPFLAAVMAAPITGEFSPLICQRNSLIAA